MEDQTKKVTKTEEVSKSFWYREGSAYPSTYLDVNAFKYLDKNNWMLRQFHRVIGGRGAIGIK